MNALIVADYREGMSITDVGRKHGLSDYAVKRILAATGTPTRMAGGSTKWSAAEFRERVNRLHALLRDTARAGGETPSNSELAACIGAGLSTISRVIGQLDAEGRITVLNKRRPSLRAFEVDGFRTTARTIDRTASEAKPKPKPIIPRGWLMTEEQVDALHRGAGRRQTLHAEAAE